MPLRALWNRIRAAGIRSDSDPLLERALDLADAGDARGAQALCEQILAQQPGHARALHLNGVLALQTGDLERAESAIQHAIRSDGNVALFHFNLGNVVAAKGEHARASRAFSTSVRLNPTSLPAWFNLGKAYIESGQFDDAARALQKALEVDPHHGTSLVEWGRACYQKACTTHLAHDYQHAIEILGRALQHSGLSADELRNVHLFMGDSLDQCKRHGAAIDHFRAVLSADPDNLDALVKMGNALNQLGRMADAMAYCERVLTTAPEQLGAISTLITVADYLPLANPQDNTRRRFTLAGQLTQGPAQTEWPNTPNPERKLRIGYVSPDLRTHVAMYLFEEVWRLHNREQFEWFVYDATPVRDAKSAALRIPPARWREIDAVPVSSLPALIAADRIDILVDLAGHTSNNRLVAFAAKPAPVQASWLAYPGSTGLEAIDYLISDRHTSPPEFDHHASEQVWRLPDTRFCYQPPAGAPSPALPTPDAPITFGCFNNLAKLNPEVLLLWRRILEAVPEARLVIKSFALDDPLGRSLFEQELANAGIATGRVTLLGTSSYLDNFAAYHQIHMALDPFPFCGGLTSLDALWMGVPIVTLTQELMAGRQTQAFLNVIGHNELVAETPEDYVRLAVALARSPERIAAYRQGLREAMQRSALLDFAQFTRHLEEAYRTMWRRWCTSAAPKPPHSRTL